MSDLISRSALYDEIRKLPLLSEYGRVAWEYSLAIEHLLKIVNIILLNPKIIVGSMTIINPMIIFCSDWVAKDGE